MLCQAFFLSGFSCKGCWGLHTVRVWGRSRKRWGCSCCGGRGRTASEAAWVWEQESTAWIPAFKGARRPESTLRSHEHFSSGLLISFLAGLSASTLALLQSVLAPQPKWSFWNRSCHCCSRLAWKPLQDSPAPAPAPGLASPPPSLFCSSHIPPACSQSALLAAC